MDHAGYVARVFSKALVSKNFVKYSVFLYNADTQLGNIRMHFSITAGKAQDGNRTYLDGIIG